MLYAFAKLKKIEHAEGENEYNVIRIGGESEEELKANLDHYVAEGYEVATEEEWVANSTPVEETAEEIVEEAKEEAEEVQEETTKESNA